MKKIFLLANLCLLISSVIAQNTGWAKRIGGSNGNDLGNTIALDLQGCVYASGYFSGTVDFDPGIGVYNLTSAGGNDIFILKLSPSGNFIWARRFGGVSNEESRSITTDIFGNVYNVGDFMDTVDFDPGLGVTKLVSAGAKDAYISKLDSSGNFIWANRIGGSSDDLATNLCISPSGNIYFTGAFKGTVDFNPDTGTFNLIAAGSGAFYDVFICALNDSGRFSWACRWGSSTGDDLGFSIALDSTGNVYSTGQFSGTVDFNPGTGTFNLSVFGANDIYISKLNSSGGFVWVRRIGGSGDDRGRAISTLTQGFLYCTGMIWSGTAYDIFIVKMDLAGNTIWNRQMGGPNNDAGTDIISDAAGNVYTTGYFLNTVDFDPNAGVYNLISSGTFDAFISKLNASGNFIWAKKFGGSSDDNGLGIDLDSLQNVYTTGIFSNSVDFDPGPTSLTLSSSGFYDVFISKLNSIGLLPVKLTRFEAIKNEQIIQLRWQTSSEINFKGFELERLIEKNSWEVIASIPSNGNSNKIINYDFNDLITDEMCCQHPINYRLRMVDKDGTFEYSKIIQVLPNENAYSDEFEIFPNPFSDEFQLKFKNDFLQNYSSEDGLEIEIFNMLGIKVFAASYFKLEYTNSIKANIPSGIYTIKIGNHLNRIIKK